MGGGMGGKEKAKEGELRDAEARASQLALTTLSKAMGGCASPLGWAPTKLPARRTPCQTSQVLQPSPGAGGRVECADGLHPQRRDPGGFPHGDPNRPLSQVRLALPREGGGGRRWHVSQLQEACGSGPRQRAERPWVRAAGDPTRQPSPPKPRANAGLPRCPRAPTFGWGAARWISSWA